MTTTPDVPAWEAAFDAFKSTFDLPDDGLGIFAIDLRFGLDDPRAAAADAITGGNDDKSCDVVFLDRDRGVAVIAQCYWAQVLKSSAPANKAASLNQAVTWLLSVAEDQIPSGLRERALELRAAIHTGEVSELHLWFVHNLPESQNVRLELQAAEYSARKHLAQGTIVNVFSREIGCGAFEDLYASKAHAIAVTNTFTINVPDAIEVKEGSWSSLLTVVPGAWLHELFNTHQESLFSSNVRDYLGSRASDANINNGIKTSAINDPENFFIFNNGVTAVVLDYQLGKRGGKGRALEIRGVSIVNGAQTTGSIGNVGAPPSDDLRVAARFVKCNDPAIIEKVVRFNNSQNVIRASDFRSNDAVQDRLRTEFKSLDGASYEGGRRGGTSDAMKRSRTTLPSYTVGQVLTAFHGDPVAAYDKKSDIWANDKLYNSAFNERTNAAHILFCYSLLEAITTRHLTLTKKSRLAEELLEAEQQELGFLKLKGANYLLVYAISRAIETLIGRVVTNRFDLRFEPGTSVSAGAALWDLVLDRLMPFTSALTAAFPKGRISREDAEGAVGQFLSAARSVFAAAPPPAAFAEKVLVAIPSPGT